MYSTVRTFAKARSSREISAETRGVHRAPKGADRDWCSVWSSKPVCPAETRVGGFDSHTPPPLAARGQTSHGIRGALHLRWTASRARPYCNSRFTMCNPWFTMPVSLASLCVAPRTNSAAAIGPCGPQMHPGGIRGTLHPCWIASLLRCFLGEWLRHAPREAPCQPGASSLSVLARAHPRTASSRLVSGALRASRCSRETVHGLLAVSSTPMGRSQTARRGVAQPGSAPALGAGGPRFESGRPDWQGVVGMPWRAATIVMGPGECRANGPRGETHCG